MSAGSQDRRYPCRTQCGVEQTYGSPPKARSSGGRRQQIKVGCPVEPLIPRWEEYTELLYFVEKEGFNDADFQHVVSSFRAAAADWNAIPFGVTISRTENKALANFPVCYHEDDYYGTLATAFLPNYVTPVYIYKMSLTDPFWRSHLKGTLLHEIGHIIGLRHEFSNDVDEFGEALEPFAHQIGRSNPNSVMSYNADKRINEDDRQDVLAFYRMATGTTINECPIVDYWAWPFLW